MSTKDQSESTTRAESAEPRPQAEEAPKAEPRSKAEETANAEPRPSAEESAKAGAEGDDPDRPKPRRVVRSATTKRADEVGPGEGEAAAPARPAARPAQPQGSLLDAIAPRRRPSLDDLPPPPDGEAPAPAAAPIPLEAPRPIVFAPVAFWLSGGELVFGPVIS